MIVTLCEDVLNFERSFTPLSFTDNDKLASQQCITLDCPPIWLEDIIYKKLGIYNCHYALQMEVNSNPNCTVS